MDAVRRPSALCAGVIVADHVCPAIPDLPPPGGLTAVDELVLNIGGLAANASVILARLGASVQVCGRVGDDLFGRFVAETFEAAGVATDGLVVDPQRITSQTLILNVQGQDRRFIHCFGANAGLAVDDLQRACQRLDEAGDELRVFYLGGFLILPGLEIEPLRDLLRNLRRRGVVTLLDVATPGPADYLSPLRTVLPEVDVFLPNSDEAALILPDQPDDPLSHALAFRDLGARRSIVTCGDRGCVSVSDAGQYRVGTYDVEAIDGSGGGDAFDSGYLLGLLEGRDELDCLRFASALGASCVRALGTTAGIFQGRDELQDFLDRLPLDIQEI